MVADDKMVFLWGFQFYRSFPRPPEVTEEDCDLLVSKYRDPQRSGLLNYINLHHDVEAIRHQMQQEEAMTMPEVPQPSDFLPQEVCRDSVINL